MFKENKIFGQGPNAYRYLCSDQRFKLNYWSCSTHPHNYYFQLLAETGLVGFIFIFGAFLMVLFRCFKIFFLY